MIFREIPQNQWRPQESARNYHLITVHLKNHACHTRNALYHRIAEEGYPIGSGEVEAANKLLVVQRLKRSGQSWGRDGGQGVLSQRALLKSGRFDRAWEMLVSKLNRSNKNWEPVMCAANDNRLMGIAA